MGGRYDSEYSYLKRILLKRKLKKFPLSGSMAWFSTRGSPKPMTRMYKVRVKSLVTTNTTAHTLNLREGKQRCRQEQPPALSWKVRASPPSCQRLSWAPEDGSRGQLACLQLLIVLISEVDQPGHVEEEFG